VSDIRPIGERVLVRLIPAETVTKEGLILPTTHKANLVKATIIALADPPLNDLGEYLRFPYAIGDTVVLIKYAGIEVGEDELIVKQDEIVAVIEE